jgi:small conductance mechanosensitive channel
MDINLEKLSEQAAALLLEYGPKFILAIILLLVGLRLIKFLTKQVKQIAEKQDIDKTVSRFMSNLLSWLLKAILVISVVQMFGVATTSFVAVLGAMGLAVGLALQGTLSNFAGGVLLLIFKHYKIGDVIEVMGHTGTVTSIKLITTDIKDFDGRLHICPNGEIMNNDITNRTKLEILRAEVNVGISYDADIKGAKDVLMQVLKNHDRVLKDPEPFVGVVELGGSSVNLVARGWCKSEEKFAVQTDLIEKCKIALDEAEFEIPFPQMDVHLDK